MPFSLTTRPHHVVGVSLERVVVADDKELGETPDLQDLLGQVVAPAVVQVGHRLVEEGDVNRRNLAQERQG